jgi:NADPH2:quinone reductase
MKAIQLIKHGDADKAFRITELPAPVPGEGEVLIRVESFGLNFADVMSRRHLYKDAPSLPFIPGYEVVGVVEESRAGEIKAGERVVAFTRFGGYAEYVTAPALAVTPLPETITNGEGTALATQYCTAWHAAIDMANIREGELVLIHAAAGGVGIAITQMAHMRGATVIGTAGSEEKIRFLKETGVEYAINYREKDFEKEVPALTGGRLPDVIFDPVGGKNFGKSRKILNYGGRIVAYGASSQLNMGKGPVGPLKLLFGFGFLHPVGLIVNSKGVLGVNMLKIADHKPEVLQKAMQEVVRHTAGGEFRPVVGKEYPAEEIAEAHAFFESRQSIGKIVLHWH